MRSMNSAFVRLLSASLLLAGLGGCTNGINAGVDGGLAFIAFAATLVFTVLVLWFILGRGE